MSCENVLFIPSLLFLSSIVFSVSFLLEGHGHLNAGNLKLAVSESALTAVNSVGCMNIRFKLCGFVI